MDWQLGGALRLGWLLMVDPNLPGPQSCKEVDKPFIVMKVMTRYFKKPQSLKFYLFVHKANYRREMLAYIEILKRIKLN